MTVGDIRTRTTIALLASVGAAIVVPILIAARSAELTMFVVVYCLIAALFLAYFVRRMGVDLLAPAIAWPVILFLYLLAPALNALAPGRLPLDFEVSPAVLRIYYVCGIVGLAGFAAGTITALRGRVRLARPLAEHSMTMAQVAAVAAVLVLPFAFSTDLLPVLPYAERAIDLRLERMASSTSGLYEAAAAAVTTLFLATATWLVFRGGSYSIRFVAASAILFYVAVNTLAGWRGVVVAALCIPLAFYHYRIKRVGAVTAIAIAIAIYLFMAVLSVVRTTSNPTEMVRNLSEYFLDEGMSFAELDSVTELHVGGNLMRLIIGVEENETTFTLGGSVLSELAVYVPRALNPDRPLSMSETYMELFYPGARQQGEGRGLFILAEGYWAFGLLGVFAFMFVYGWSVELVYETLVHHARNDFGALFYGVVFYALVVEAVRSGVLLSYKVALIRTVPFLIVIVLAHMAPFIAPGAPRRRSDSRVALGLSRRQLPSR